MRLLTHWRRIVRKAWSFRLVALAALLSTCEMILPLFVDALPRHLFSILSLLAITGAMIARLVAQKEFIDDK